MRIISAQIIRSKSSCDAGKSLAAEQAAMVYCHKLKTSNKMHNQINGIAPKYWGAYKGLALGMLDFGWNQVSNEILYWAEK